MYLVQCLNGCVYEATPGSDLEARCKRREEEGFIDALPIHLDDFESEEGPDPPVTRCSITEGEND